MVDSGELRNTILIIIGSHALDVLRGEEVLSGRRGKYLGIKNVWDLLPKNSSQ